MKKDCSLFNQSVAYLLKTDALIILFKTICNFFFTIANKLKYSQTQIQSSCFDGKLLMDNVCTVCKEKGEKN